MESKASKNRCKESQQLKDIISKENEIEKNKSFKQQRRPKSGKNL